MRTNIEGRVSMEDGHLREVCPWRTNTEGRVSMEDGRLWEEYPWRTGVCGKSVHRRQTFEGKVSMKYEHLVEECLGRRTCKGNMFIEQTDV